MKTWVFPGLDVYWDVEVGVLEVHGLEVMHSPGWREVLIDFGVSVLNFSVFRNLFRVLRSKIGLHCCWVLEPKNRLKEPAKFDCILVHKCMQCLCQVAVPDGR